MIPFAGAVLCGGASRRMGADKSLIELHGMPMAGRVAFALAGAGAEPVVAVGGDAAALRRHGIEVVADHHPGEGPLGAIITALVELAPAELVAVLACDLVAPDPGAIAALVARAAQGDVDVAVPVFEGRPHFHHAVWHRRAAEPLQALFAAGERAPRRAAASLVVGEVMGIPERSLRDADDPLTLAAARRAAGRITFQSGLPVRSEHPEEDRVDVPAIDVDELAAVKASAVVFDVREPDEYDEAHVPGAIPVPLATVPDHMDDFPTDGPVYVICASGGRSMRAAQFLRSNGVDAVNVTGGTKAWLAAGHPHERGHGAG